MMDSFMSIIPVVAIGTMAFLFLQFTVDVVLGKYRTEK